MIDLLQRNLPHRCHSKVFPWLYFKNPEGAARAWVAVDSERNRLVGMAAAFPRRFYENGAEARGYVLGDFCIDLENRSLGVALMLQRACLAGLPEAGACLAFDFPSRNMMAVYRRLRIEAGEDLVRYSKPLRMDRSAHARISIGFAARWVSVLGNAALRLRDSGSSRQKGWRVGLEAGPWGEEFTRAAEEWTRAGISVVRTAPYLNWRYGEHPLQAYEMITVRDEERLLGYLVQHTDGEVCTVDDLLTGNARVGAALLEEATALARHRRLQTLCAPWLSKDPGNLLLGKCGFHRRESTPVILLNLPAGQTGIHAENAGWRLTSGDWES